jgi:putative addiction module killer protein
MKRKIIAYENYYEVFFNSLDIKTQDKLLYGLMLLGTQDRLPAKFVKYIQDGVFELRIEFNGNIYRLFFCFDGGYIVILLNGFQKKTQKTPVNEIAKAIKLKNEYYKSKKEEENENL